MYDALEVRALGPLSAEIGGRSATPTANKPRQLLALLALNANQVLHTSTLLDEIWSPSDLPRSALATLHTYVLQIRRQMGRALGENTAPAAKGILVTHPGGYLLELAPEAVDITVYRRLLSHARSAVAHGDDHAAVRAYDEALAVWRGPALVDVRAGSVLQLEVAQLEESRLGATQERIDAWLRLGGHADLLGELTSLVGRHPLNENLHAQFMTALYRAGRQNQAIETFQSLRRRLVNELGVEPSRQVRSLHEAILLADPALDAARPDSPRPALFPAA